MGKKFKLLLFSSLLVSRLLVSNPVQASEDFVSRYEVSYQVHPSGLTTVHQKISLTNKLSNIYATEYALTTGSADIHQVKAWDNLGPLKTSISPGENNNTIHLWFNEKVVGKDKTLEFHLEYESPNFASRKGQTWELTIPKISNIQKIDHYLLTLHVPPSFDQAAYLTPEAINNQFPVYHFDREAAAKGIIAVFGNFQVFDFRITYPLSNNSSTSKKFQISLPPDTSHQKVFYQKLEPKPETILIDKDNNWLASYELEPGAKIKVLAEGSTQIFLNSIQDQTPPPVQLNDYLKPQRYWESDHPEIKKLAQELKTPYQIYQFVVNKLQYDYQKIGEAERLGALQALYNPQSALCMEFTDLFIALSRAAGIPAREINGFAHTENPEIQPLSLKEDILHAWPEYWDNNKQAWIAIDPTWEKTTGGVDFFNKLDFDHFVFVIHGQDSIFPQVPGEGPEKNVQVNFAEKLPETREKIEVIFNIPEKNISGKIVSGKIIIQNQGNTALHDLNLMIKNKAVQIDSLPPFSDHVFPLTLSKVSWWKTKKEKVVVIANQRVFEKEITTLPFFWQIISFFDTTLSAVIVKLSFTNSVNNVKNLI